jgi:O-antigen/teichoic acid export membrane protein
VYGAGFEAAVGPFILLLPGVVALAIQRPLGPLLVKRGRMGLVAVFGAVTLGLNVVLTIVLLHVLGIRGAAVASSVCYIGLAVAYVAVTRGERGWRALVPTSVDVARVARALRPSR